MVSQEKRITVTPELELVRLLEAAQNEPVLLEQEGVVFRLTKESEAPQDHDTDGAAVAQRRESESLVDYAERVSDAIMRGRYFEDDSTDLVNQGREERTRELP